MGNPHTSRPVPERAHARQGQYQGEMGNPHTSRDLGGAVLRDGVLPLVVVMMDANSKEPTLQSTNLIKHIC